MAALARKPTSSAADEIRRAIALAEEIIEREAIAQKQSPSGAALPIDWIRGNLRKGRHPCDVALELLEKQKNG